jgi:hypothetical protein
VAGGPGPAFHAPSTAVSQIGRTVGAAYVVRWGARATVVRPSKVRYSLSTTGGHPPRPGHGGYERPLYAQQGRSIYGMNPFEGDHSRILERASPSSFEICGGQAARSTGSLTCGRDCRNQDSPTRTPREAALRGWDTKSVQLCAEEAPNSEKPVKEKQAKRKGPFHVKRALKKCGTSNFRPQEPTRP